MIQKAWSKDAMNLVWSGECSVFLVLICKFFDP